MNKCPKCGSSDPEFYLSPCGDDYWLPKGADAFHAPAKPGRESTVVRSSPPTAAGIVSWCHGDQSEWTLKGVQHMLDRYVETSSLADTHKDMCGHLREFCEWRHLGLGGEPLDRLVLEHAMRLELMISRMRGYLQHDIKRSELARKLDTEAIALMPPI